MLTITQFPTKQSPQSCRHDTKPYSGTKLTREKGEQTKSDLELLGQIWYSFKFEELGLGFGGERVGK